MSTETRRAAHIIVRAISILAYNWTNKGYKIKQADGTFKVCVFAALSQASQELYGNKSYDHDLAPEMVQRVSMELYGRSGVSVNDDLGLPHVMRVLAISLERLMKDAFRITAYTR